MNNVNGGCPRHSFMNRSADHMQADQKIKIIPYTPRHLNGAIAICHATGFMGYTLEGTDRFNDRKLFAYLFCWYYLCYEPQHCFIAIDTGKGSRVAGYIIGTTDTAGMLARLPLRLYPRILTRLICVTMWRYHESYSELLYWLRNGATESDPPPEGYPAHLHINILHEYQGLGIGSRLMQSFETMCANQGIEGIYLETSSHNNLAIPFYLKHGYQVLDDKEMTFWSGVDDYRKITFGKKLG